MSVIQQQDLELRALREAVQKAVETGADLQGKISRLMTSALSSGDLDLSRIHQVTRAVLEGVAGAVDSTGNVPPGHIREAVAGVEDALLMAAEASRLATQEAVGRIAGFTRQDLKKALDDLGSIEELFLETLQEVAHSGTAAVSVIFGDFLEHLKRSGTDLGDRLQEIVQGLAARHVQPGGLKAGADAMQQAARQLAEIAGDILAGTANGLSGSRDQRTVHTPHDKEDD